MSAMLGSGCGHGWTGVGTHATASPFYSAAVKMATTEATNSLAMKWKIKNSLE